MNESIDFFFLAEINSYGWRAAERLTISIGAVIFGYLGYRLYVLGVTEGASKVKLKSAVASVAVSGAGPGIVFLAFGACTLLFALYYGGASDGGGKPQPEVDVAKLIAESKSQTGERLSQLEERLIEELQSSSGEGEFLRHGEAPGPAISADELHQLRTQVDNTVSAIQAGMEFIREETQRLEDLIATVESVGPTQRMFNAIASADLLALNEALAAGADALAQTDSEELYTPLIFAAKHRATRLIHTLVQAGADLERRNRWGYSPMTAAIEEEDLEFVTELIANGANVMAVAESGDTLLDCASDEESKINKFLQSKGAIRTPEDD